MKSYLLSLLLLTIGLVSCDNNDKKQNISDNSEITIAQSLPINDYIKKFVIVDLPFYFEGWNVNNIDNNKLSPIDKYSIDTLFFKGENEDIIYRYGLLADTTSYYSLIYFGQGEEKYPILVTYSKSGQLISNETLIVNGCGSDCGLTYCSSSALIRKDFSIYLADTAKYEGICDSLGNYIPNSDSTFVNSKIGHVDKNGFIKLDKEQRQATKNSP
jgi:hypothetical protein